MAMWFGICATIGVTLLVCQLVLTVVGFGGHHAGGGDAADAGSDGDAGHLGGVDHHGDHGSNWFFGVISLRTLIAALAFFGLAGLGLNAMGLSPLIVLGGAALAGFGAMHLVHWLMQSLALLRADGTVRLDQAVGATGTVYIPIPGQHQGIGKISLNLDAQMVELAARTPAESLPTGTKIVVTKVLQGELVEVMRAKSTIEPPRL
jgi:hypothetical protein